MYDKSFDHVCKEDKILEGKQQGEKSLNDKGNKRIQIYLFHVLQ